MGWLVVLPLGLLLGVTATLHQAWGGWGTGGRPFVIFLFIFVVVAFLIALVEESWK